MVSHDCCMALVCLQLVIVVFLDHTHLLFSKTPKLNFISLLISKVSISFGFDNNEHHYVSKTCSKFHIKIIYDVKSLKFINFNFAFLKSFSIAFVFLKAFYMFIITNVSFYAKFVLIG